MLRGAPLNRQKFSVAGFFSTEARRFFHLLRPLSILLPIALLSFAHCSSSGGGGGGGGGSTPPPDPITCESEAEDGGLSFAGGDGTEDTPFEVSSAEELENIGQLLYCNYRLTQNIDLSGVANWTPIGAESPCDGGNDDACFQGALDGNGKMISDLTVNITGDYGGLFGYTGEHAEIRSVGLSGLSVMAMLYVGGLVGWNEGSISNSYAIGAVTAGTISCGGLVGNNAAASISNSYAAGEASGTSRTGGLVGWNSSGNLSGINYFADDVGGSDGIGIGANSGSCDSAVCMQAMGGNDAARATWLEDSLDETLDSGLNWDAEVDAEGNAVWGNLNAAGFPCLKNMPAGAPACP